MTTNAPQAPKPDLDTLIREAEQRVIAADRDWQRHTEALTVSVRGHAGRMATLGAVGLASTLAGGLLLRWRLSARSRAREKLLTRALAKVSWPSRVTPARAAAAAAAPVGRSTGLMSVLATVGTLLGVVARTGLKLPAKSGVTSMAVRVLMPMLTRWLRSRTTPPPPPRAPQPMRPPAAAPVRPVAPVALPGPAQGPRPG